MTYQLNSLIIEVTRYCNMSCGHCLRGYSRKTEVNLEKLRHFLDINKFGYFSDLTLTGGEISIRPSVVHKVIDILKEYSINFEYFYLVTNGKRYSKRFISALNRLVNMALIPEMCCLVISNDRFHEPVNQDNIERYEEWARYAGIEFHHKKKPDNSEVLARGHGANIPKAFNRPVTTKFYKMDEDTETGVPTIQLDNYIYFNAVGGILLDCDLPYEDQKEHRIGTYKNTMEELINNAGFSN